MVGITRHNSDSLKIRECDAFVDRVPDNDEIDAQMSFNESVNEERFGDQYVQKTLESRDVMDQQGSAQDDQLDEDSIPGLEPYTNDSTSDNDDNEYAAVESECSIVDETVRLSPMKMRTRSKARRSLVIPDADICSDVEDDEPRPRQRKRNPAIATMPRAGGTSKFFRRNSNQFPCVASKALAARKSQAGTKGRK